MSMPTRSIAILLFGVLITGGLLVVLAIHPGAATLRTQVGDAAIYFSSDRRWVVRSGDCVQVRWNVQHIQAVYLNGAGRIGAGSETFCIKGEPREFKLEVHFPDSTIRDYVLKVGFIGYAPEVWLLTLTGLTLLIAVLYQAVAPAIRRRSPRFVRGVRYTLRWAAIFVGSLITAALILELGLRFYFSRYGTEEDRQKYLYSDEELRRIATLMAFPFMDYGLSQAGGNRLGYRGEEVAIPKPEGVFRVVVLGDSTVYGLATPAGQTFPAQLQAILRDQYGYSNVEVVNAGVAGYNSWLSVTNLAFRVLELEPDLIIIYHTITDIGMRQFSPDCYRGYNAHRGLPPLSVVLQPHDQVTSPSVLYRFVGINLGWFDPPDPDRNFDYAIECANQARPPLQEILASNPPVYFERNLRTMVSIARGYGFQVMLSTWAYDESTPPDQRPDWWPAAPEHNRVIRQVAEDMNTLFYDLEASEMSTNPANWGSDRVHPTIVGYQKQAGLYAAYLVESGVFSSPPNTD